MQMEGSASSMASKEGKPGKFYSHLTIFRSSWEQVFQSLWQRYPNPYSKHVLSEDIVDRRIEGSKLVSKRFLSKTNRGPKWIEVFTGDKPTLIIEDSIVDPAARTFTTYTKNITSTKLLSVEEKCVYYVSPDNQNETCCLKQAWVKCKVRGLSRAVEKFSVDRYRKNAHKAEVGLEHVIEKLFFMPKFGVAKSSGSR